MTKLDYFVVCENVLNDGGRISLINIFDAINAKQLPASAPKFNVAFAFLPQKTNLSSGKTKFKIGITKPNETNLFSAEGEAEIHKSKEVNSEKSKIAGALDLSGGLIFDEAGGYAVNLSVDGKHVGTTYFEVKKV